MTRGDTDADSMIQTRNWQNFSDIQFTCSAAELADKWCCSNVLQGEIPALPTMEWKKQPLECHDFLSKVGRMAVFGGSGTTANTDSNTSGEKHCCLCSAFLRANITTTLNFFVQEYLTLMHVPHLTDLLNTESGQASVSEPHQRPPPPEPVAKDARLMKFYERRS